MAEHVWENGYAMVVDRSKPGPLRDFWRHYYGADAEMSFSGSGLMALFSDIMLIKPSLADDAALATFLTDLERMCLRAYSGQGRLQVIAD